MKQSFLLCTLLFSLMACHKDYTINTNRVQIPLIISDGVKPRVYITVGQKQIEVIFDTGSSGLRVLSGALGGENITSLNQRVQYGYNGGSHGLNIRGKVVAANFGLGNLESQQPIPFMLIDSVQYISNGKSHSWIATGNEAMLTTDSSSYGGFSAIMGVGMRMDSSHVGSPIPQMPGNGQYVVHFPPAGQTTGGYIIINPSGLDLVKFKNAQSLDKGHFLLPNGDRSFADDSVKGTLTIGGIAYAKPTLLDTGNPAIWTESPSAVGSDTQPAGTIVTMTVGSDPIVANTTFTVHHKQPGVDLVQVNHNSRKTANSFGAQFFFTYDVLFDAVKGQIWIAGK